jgi:hypothetical protein
MAPIKPGPRWLDDPADDAEFGPDVPDPEILGARVTISRDLG